MKSAWARGISGNRKVVSTKVQSGNLMSNLGRKVINKAKTRDQHCKASQRQTRHPRIQRYMYVSIPHATKENEMVSLGDTAISLHKLNLPLRGGDLEKVRFGLGKENESFEMVEG